MSTPAALAQVPQTSPLPEGIEVMIRQAATRDGTALDTVESLALDAYPDHAEAIGALTRDLRDQRKKAERDAKRAAGSSVIAGWSGDGELGASLSSGNTDDRSLAIRLNLVKETLRWRHEITSSADLQRASGETSKERYTAGYKPNYFINPRLYAAGEFTWERDLFAGYRHRLTETVGIGYLILDSDGKRLSVEGGPGARHSFQVRAPGVSAVEHEFVFGANANYTQEFNENIKFAQTIKTLTGDQNQTLESSSSLTARINSLFSARIGFTLRHETEPPDDRKQTDTLSRATLVYTF
ncbi:DUF481 domain-containing protein [Niveispirillum fermenti]|uniref:DUF481 domain-containing protein n=1 Tax=Niveispirillum fermenti TaxID=1233113 RepID=UPI003A8B9310